MWIFSNQQQKKKKKTIKQKTKFWRKYFRFGRKSAKKYQWQQQQQREDFIGLTKNLLVAAAAAPRFHAFNYMNRLAEVYKSIIEFQTFCYGMH